MRVRTFDELGDAPANERDSFTVRVRANGPDLLLELRRTVENVLRPLVLDEFGEGWVLHERGDLRAWWAYVRAVNNDADG